MENHSSVGKENNSRGYHISNKNGYALAAIVIASIVTVGLLVYQVVTPTMCADSTTSKSTKEKFFAGCNNSSPTTRSSFLDVFVGVYEKTPWIVESVWPEHFEHVEKLWDVTDAKSVEKLLLAMRKSVDTSEKEKKLALLKSHPDLACKLAVATFKDGITDEKSEKALTSHSQQEQKSAGLDQCSPEELEKFQSNNKSYKEKFGFPYILAVSGRTRAEILENFTQRVGNEVDAEFSEAIKQVHRIAKIRVGKIVGECK